MAEAHFHRMPGLLEPIFAAAGTGQRDFREAAFLTFTFDPAFFETRILGKLRATGAAVTVVADGNIFDPDPRSLRAAGTHYALGVATTNGAFHPKVFVLTGPTRTVMGIGSGNLTTSGWHANDELLTIVEAERSTGAPQIVVDAATFLRDLPAKVPMGPVAAAGLLRTADQLDSLVADSTTVDTGHRLLTTLAAPILEQLPDQHVPELRVSAPFHDRQGKALEALLERFRPSKVTLLAQAGRAVMDPTTLRRKATEHGTELTFAQLEGDQDGTTRYRHGKLIEAISGDQVVWSLTGSPNITAAALMRDVTQERGNCEVAILTTQAAHLLPAPLQTVTDEPGLDNSIPASPDPDQSQERAGANLLQANLVRPDGVEVHLDRAADQPLLVEVSPFRNPPEVFEELGRIPPGEQRLVLPGTFEPGSRVRVRRRVLPLHDPDLVVHRLRPGGGYASNRDVTAIEIFASDTVAAAWRDALVQLLTSQQAGQPGSAGTSAQEPVAHPGWSTLDEPDRWGEYTQEAALRLGMPIFHLATGADPTSIVGAGLTGAAPAWEDRFDDLQTDTFEDEDQSAEAAEEAADKDADRPGGELTEPQRSRIRAFVKDLVKLAPTLPPWERIAAVQLAITSTSTPVWDTEGRHWWPATLADALACLDVNAWPGTSKEQAAAVAAVGLYRLRMALPPDERGAVARRVKEVSASLRTLVGQAREERVAANLDMLTGTTLLERTATDVIDELTEALDPDTRRTTLRLLSRAMPGLDLSWASETVLVADGEVRNPLATAVAILREADLEPPVAVGVNGKGSWAVIARTEGRITTVEGADKTARRFKTFDTAGLPFPLQALQPGRRTISRPPWSVADETDLEALLACGVTSWPLTTDPCEEAHRETQPG